MKIFAFLAVVGIASAQQLPIQIQLSDQRRPIQIQTPPVQIISDVPNRHWQQQPIQTLPEWDNSVQPIRPIQEKPRWNNQFPNQRPERPQNPQFDPNQRWHITRPQPEQVVHEQALNPIAVWHEGAPESRCPVIDNHEGHPVFLPGNRQWAFYMCWGGWACKFLKNIF